MPETTETEGIVREIQIEASPETVFGFFTEPEKLTRWLAEEATLDPRPGGVNHQTHPGGPDNPRGPYYMRGEFLEVTPPSRVVFTWGFENPDIEIAPGGSTVDVTLEPVAGGTLVRLVHRDLPESELASHREGWTAMLERLAAAVEGR
jgi:uncharacterized protein YndB with AHSA1/START domain